MSVDSDFGWAVSVFSGAFAKWAADAVADLPGGPRGYLVLDAVSRGQQRSQLALAQRLGIDKTAMTYLLDELERAKLVTRRPDPADRRARQIAITAQETRKLQTAREQIAVTENRLLAVLDADDTAAFRRMLEQIALQAPRTRPPASTRPRTVRAVEEWSVRLTWCSRG